MAVTESSDSPSDRTSQAQSGRSAPTWPKRIARTLNSEESAGYKSEQCIERVSSTCMTWHRSARKISSSQPTTVLFPGYMVHD